MLAKKPSPGTKIKTRGLITPFAIHRQNFFTAAAESLRCFYESYQTISFKTSRRPKLSIIVVTHNQPALILRCLQSLLSIQSINYEIIVVDNASDPWTSYLFNQLRGIRLYPLKKNIHFLKAANLGASKARGKFLLFLNSDCFPSAGAVESCLEVLETDSDIGAVGPKVLNINGSIQEAGSIIWRDASTRFYGTGASPFCSEVNFQRDVDFVSGAFLMTPRKVFRKLGGFDKRYTPAYYEDTDYCVRLHRQKLRVIYTHQAVVTHVLNGSATVHNQALNFVTKNKKIFQKRHAKWLKNKLSFSPTNLLRASRYEMGKNRILFIEKDIDDFQENALSKQHMITLKHSEITVFTTNTKRNFSSSFLGMDPGTEIYSGVPVQDFLAQRAGYYDSIWIASSSSLTSDPEVDGRYSKNLSKAIRADLQKNVKLSKQGLYSVLHVTRARRRPKKSSTPRSNPRPR